MALDWMPFCLKIFLNESFDTWYFLAKEFVNFIDWVYCAIHLIDNTLLSEDFSNENLYLRKHFGIFGENFINQVFIIVPLIFFDIVL